MAAMRVSEVAIRGLREDMRVFLEQIDNLLASSPDEFGGMVLNGIEGYAQVDGRGNVGLAGIVGIEDGWQGGLRLVLRRRPKLGGECIALRLSRSKSRRGWGDGLPRLRTGYRARA